MNSLTSEAILYSESFLNIYKKGVKMSKKFSISYKPFLCTKNSPMNKYFHGEILKVVHKNLVFFTSVYAALWSPAGKWLTSWLLFVILIVFLSLSRCGT